MLIFLVVFGVEAVFRTLGLLESAPAASVLASLNATAAFLFAPLVALAWLAAPPFLAFVRGRRWWVWLLAAIGLGPFALVVTVLPRGEPRDATP